MYYTLAKAFVAGSVAIFAQAAPEGLDISDLLRYGVIGTVLILVMTGHLRLRREVEERDQRLAKQDAVIENYRSIYERDVIPMLNNAVELMREMREERRGGRDDH